MENVEKDCAQTLRALLAEVEREIEAALRRDHELRALRERNSGLVARYQARAQLLADTIERLAPSATMPDGASLYEGVTHDN